MTPPRSFPPDAGRPFTLWQDPARWPVPPLRLPARAFTLWLNPDAWPQRVCRLPGRGFTLWLDPARWPVPPLTLPGMGFTLWLNPATWPEPPRLSLPVSLPPPVMPIVIPPNKAFTLWTRPNHVTPIPMRNGLTAAQAAATAGPEPVPAIPLAAKPAVAEAAAPIPFVHRLLPIAAGLVAILGINGLMQVAESKKSDLSTAEVAGLNQQIELSSKDLLEKEARNQKASADYREKAALLEAKALVLKEENDRLVTQLTQARDRLTKAEAGLADQSALSGRLETELDRLKLSLATADTKAQGAVVAATEEASAVKRAAAAEVVKLQETLAGMEAEKAAALREAATAARENASLQQTLDTLRKPAP